MTVVIPVYNGARHLRQSILSVLSQTYRHFEVVVVDDGSTDDSVAIAEGFGPVVRVIRQENQGASVARNRGARESSGSLLAFIDADDVWVSGKLELQVDHMSRSRDVGLVAHRWIEWDGNPELLADLERRAPGGSALELDPQDSGWIYPRLLLDSRLHTSTVMVRRSTFDSVGGFDPDLRRGQDYDFWLKVSRVTRIEKLTAILSVYRIHAESVTRRPTARNYRAEIVTRALERWGRSGPDGTTVPEPAIRKMLSQVWTDFAVNHMLAGDADIGLDAARRAFRLQPFSMHRLMLVLKATRHAGRSAGGKANVGETKPTTPR